MLSCTGKDEQGRNRVLHGCMKNKGSLCESNATSYTLPREKNERGYTETYTAPASMVH